MISFHFLLRNSNINKNIQPNSRIQLKFDRRGRLIVLVRKRSEQINSGKAGSGRWCIYIILFLEHMKTKGKQLSFERDKRTLIRFPVCYFFFFGSIAVFSQSTAKVRNPTRKVICNKQGKLAFFDVFTSEPSCESMEDIRWFLFWCISINYLKTIHRDIPHSLKRAFVFA